MNKIYEKIMILILTFMIFIYYTAGTPPGRESRPIGEYSFEILFSIGALITIILIIFFIRRIFKKR